MNRKLAVTAFAFAVLASITSDAEAQTTLYGCYVKNTGTVYRIKTANTPSKCSSNATEFSWNMEGQAGPQGPQGPAGPAGTTGWPGVQVRTIEMSVPGGEMRDLNTFCLPTEVLLSGGHKLSGVVNGYQLLTSAPNYLDAGDQSRWGWNVRIRNLDAVQEFTVKVTAYCRLAIS